MLSWQKLLIIALLLMVLFGNGKISSFMGDLAKGIKAFKKGLAEEDEQEESETHKKEEVEEKELKRIEHQPKQAEKTLQKEEENS